MESEKIFKNKSVLNKKENKKIIFFAWYYEDGLHEFLEIWKNFLKFIWNHFSINSLVLTLFSPWKKDVSVRNWRGWHPKLAARLIFENSFSRIIGLFVRLWIVFFGVFVFFVIFLLGLLLLFIWLVSPFLVAFSIFQALNGVRSFEFVLGGLISYFAIIISIYYVDAKTPLEEMSFEELYREKIFERICNRLGTTRRAFPKETFKSYEKLNIFLNSKNITVGDFEKIIEWEIDLENECRLKKSFWRWENLKKISPVGIQWKYAYTVNLDKYSTDLSVFDPTEYRDRELNGRQEEIELLNLILQRPDQNNALIVGGSGIGKSTLIHYFANLIRQNSADIFFKGKRILILDVGRVISDAVSRGEDMEKSIRLLFMEAAYAGNIVIVIEHLERYLGKEKGVFHPDISSVISDFLANPNFQIIATSSPSEYHQLIEKNDQILKYFEVIEMREPSKDESLDILYYNLKLYENDRVVFTHEALKSIIKESGKYKWSSPLPERAIDLMMDVLMYWSKKKERLFINEQTVFEFLSLKTGVPHGEIQSGERKKLMNLETVLHQQVIGQEEAIKHVAEALRRSRSGIADSEKPVGSFLFLGPTGVGKTETAKALAKTYFGDENKMIRIDMSEFQTPNSIDRLIGSSQLNQQGRLVTKVKDNPYSLLLLDEIEKAYPEILDLFLQILDEGYVTDAFGEKINFRNTMIIATSNVGAVIIKNEVEKKSDPEKIKKEIIDYAVSNNIFRVEFLNRFDGVIFFRPLLEKELISVVKLMLKKLARRILEEKNIEVEFSESIIDEIIKKGYSPIFGARSIGRYIEDKIEEIIAEKIISGEIKKGEKIKLNL